MHRDAEPGAEERMREVEPVFALGSDRECADGRIGGAVRDRIEHLREAHRAVLRAMAEAGDRPLPELDRDALPLAVFVLERERRHRARHDLQRARCFRADDRGGEGENQQQRRKGADDDRSVMHGPDAVRR